MTGLGMEDDMNPLEFNVEVDVVGQVILTISVIAIFVERALSVLFGWRVYMERAGGKGLKEPIAFLFSAFVVWTYDFDAMAIVLKQDSSNWIGLLITTGIIAGGSKGSVKLFQDFLGWKSRAQRDDGG